MGKLTMTRRTFAKMTAATAAAVGIAGTGTALAGFKIPDWQDYKKAFQGERRIGCVGCGRAVRPIERSLATGTSRRASLQCVPHLLG